MYDRRLPPTSGGRWREPSGDSPITRFLLKRLGLSLITLWLLSMIVFAAAQLLPGDVGRTILGPLARRSVDQR